MTKSTLRDRDRKGRTGNAEGAWSPDDRPFCRFCLEDSNKLGMIHPCRCAGTMKYVHRACLDNWRANAANTQSFWRCDQCKYKYKFTKVPPVDDSKRRKMILQRIFLDLSLAAMGICICVLVLALGLAWFEGFWDSPESVSPIVVSDPNAEDSTEIFSNAHSGQLYNDESGIDTQLDGLTDSSPGGGRKEGPVAATTSSKPEDERIESDVGFGTKLSHATQEQTEAVLYIPNLLGMSDSLLAYVAAVILGLLCIIGCLLFLLIMIYAGDGTVTFDSFGNWEGVFYLLVFVGGITTLFLVGYLGMVFLFPQLLVLIMMLFQFTILSHGDDEEAHIQGEETNDCR